MNAEELYQRIEGTEDWELFIVDTVRKEQIDPWDIDIVKLAEKCLSRIKQMRFMDYRIPAKVLLSSAILLRMKSDSLVLKDTQELIQEYIEQMYYKDTELGEKMSEKKDFPLLSPAIIRVPQRKVMLTDLLGALRKVLRDEEVKTFRRVERDRMAITIVLPEVDITEAIKRLFERIKTLVTGRKFVTFFGIIPKRTRIEIARTFIPLLYLANDGKVRLEQEDYKKDIKIFLS